MGKSIGNPIFHEKTSFGEEFPAEKHREQRALRRCAIAQLGMWSPWYYPHIYMMIIVQ
jgi:hypothetical protein